MNTKIKKALIIGIAGGSGSGKTTMTNKLKEALGKDAVIICHDFYYNSNRQLPFEERCKMNYDHPSSFETALCVDDLKKLKDGQSIFRPVYSYSEHTRLEETIEVIPTKVIIFEGILIFQDKRLCDLMDIRVFVDTAADNRFIRRLQRDIEERGRSMHSVIDQYLSTVKPMHEKYVEPSKVNADVIIPSDAHNPVAFNMVLSRIKAIIDKE